MCIYIYIYIIIFVDIELSEAAEEELFVQQESIFYKKQLQKSQDSKELDKETNKQSDEKVVSKVRPPLQDPVTKPPSKRAAELLLEFEEPQSKKPRRFTFLEELEFVRQEQRHRKQDIEVLQEERRRKKELEKTMQVLKEDQKKRLAEEYRQMLEERAAIKKKNEPRFNEIFEANKAEELIREEAATVAADDANSLHPPQSVDNAAVEQQQVGQIADAEDTNIITDQELVEANRMVPQDSLESTSIARPKERSVLSLAEHVALLRERNKSTEINLPQQQNPEHVGNDEEVPNNSPSQRKKQDPLMEDTDQKHREVDEDSTNPAVKTPKPQANDKPDANENVLTEKQRRKLEARRQLELEKQHLEMRIQQEMAKKQRRLDAERQQLLQNKLLQEQKKRKKILQDKLEQEELKRNKKLKQ